MDFEVRPHQCSLLAHGSQLRVVYHEGCLESYYTSTVESPARIKAIYNSLKRFYPVVKPQPADEADVLRVHERRLLLDVRNEGGVLYHTALLAAGGALCAAQLALEKIPALAVVRPPGHHASRRRFGRFCFFNNMAVAVAFLLGTEQVRRVQIVDIDMHQGDGTQDIFADDDRVSIIDVWTKDREAYLNIIENQLSQAKGMDVLAISAGFDWSVHDWGEMLMDSDFQRLGYLFHRVAMNRTGGRLFAVLEGGYAVRTVGRTALAFCRGIEGRAPA